MRIMQWISSKNNSHRTKFIKILGRNDKWEFAFILPVFTIHPLLVSRLFRLHRPKNFYERLRWFCLFLLTHFVCVAKILISTSNADRIRIRRAFNEMANLTKMNSPRVSVICDGYFFRGIGKS